MREAGRITPSEARSRRRIWACYERRHSNALWHADWHMMKDPMFSGMNLAVVLDDSSRCAVAARLFWEATSENAVIALRDAIAAFGRPDAILSDNGVCFVEGGGRSAPMGYEADGVRGGAGAPRHSAGHDEAVPPADQRQAGEVLRSMEKAISHHDGLPEYVDYYNEYRLHFSLDMATGETPLRAFMARKATPAIRKKNPKWADEDIKDL